MHVGQLDSEPDDDYTFMDDNNIEYCFAWLPHISEDPGPKKLIWLRDAWRVKDKGSMSDALGGWSRTEYYWYNNHPSYYIGSPDPVSKDYADKNTDKDVKLKKLKLPSAVSEDYKPPESKSVSMFE